MGGVLIAALIVFGAGLAWTVGLILDVFEIADMPDDHEPTPDTLGTGQECWA